MKGKTPGPFTAKQGFGDLLPWEQGGGRAGAPPGCWPEVVEIPLLTLGKPGKEGNRVREAEVTVGVWTLDLRHWSCAQAASWGHLETHFRNFGWNLPEESREHR